MCDVEIGPKLGRSQIKDTSPPVYFSPDIIGAFFSLPVTATNATTALVYRLSIAFDPTILSPQCHDTLPFKVRCVPSTEWSTSVLSG